MKLQQNKISLTLYFELTQSNEKQESDPSWHRNYMFLEIISQNCIVGGL